MKPSKVSTRRARWRKAVTSASDSLGATRRRDIDTYMGATLAPSRRADHANGGGTVAVGTVRCCQAGGGCGGGERRADGGLDHRAAAGRRWRRRAWPWRPVADRAAIAPRELAQAV